MSDTLTPIQLAEKILKSVSAGATSISAQTAGILTKEYIDLAMICKKLVRAESFETQELALEELDAYFAFKFEKEKKNDG